MNKKAIFIPFLLFVIQPNRILSADNRFEIAKKEIEDVMEGGGPECLDYYGEKILLSNDDEVQKLLDNCRSVTLGDNWYSIPCLAIITKHYHGIWSEIKSVKEERGKATKGAKRK